MPEFVSNPCPEDWNKMKIGVNSRYCDKCTKDVIDFTKKSREEIIEYVLQQDQRVCGHFQRSQLDYSNQDLLVVVNRLVEQNRNTNKAFYFLALSALLSISCSGQSQSEENHIPKIPVIETPSELRGKVCVPKLDTNRKENQILGDTIVPIEMEDDIDLVDGMIETIGEVEIEFSSEEEEVYHVTEVMPEFPGGLVAMNKYLSDKIAKATSSWPEVIGKKVIVTFVVNTTGDIIDVEIVNSKLKKKATFDYVRSIIEQMPNWSPGLHRKQPVAVKMHLPIQFN